MGDPALLTDLVDEIAGDVLGEDTAAADLPVPDLTNGDPVVALEGMMTLDTWLGVTPGAADPRWAEVYAAPGSTAEGRIAGYFGRLRDRNDIVVERGDPWVFHEGRVVDISHLDLTDLELSLPAGAVAVAFTTSVGPYDFVDAETGEVASSRPGWHNQEWTAVLEPGPHGWVFSYVFF